VKLALRYTPNSFIKTWPSKHESAVCRLPSAVNNYNEKSARRKVIIALCLILSFLISSAAQAELSVCSNPHQTKTPSYPITIITPTDFDNMPVGSLVSIFTSYETRYSMFFYWRCDGLNGHGIGHGWLDTPGVTVVPGVSVNLDGLSWIDGQFQNSHKSILTSSVFTTPELEARGLGYVLGSRLHISLYCSPQGNSGFITDSSPVPPNYSQGLLPGQWSVAPNSPCYDNKGVVVGYPAWVRELTLHIFYAFVKIGDASQHTTLPQSFTTPIARFYIANQSNPSQQIASASINFYASDFSSRVLQRTCTTPLASESVIYFGTIPISSVPHQPGATIAERDFSVTFNCPTHSFFHIGFWVEPMYGMVAGNTNAAGYYNSAPYSLGTIKIASGTGMANGIGVQLSLVNNFYDPSNVRVREFQTNYGRLLYGADRLYLISRSVGDRDPLNTPQSHYPVARQFKARLIRLDEPLVAGQIKAAILIHIRYN